MTLFYKNGEFFDENDGRMIRFLDRKDKKFLKILHQFEVVNEKYDIENVRFDWIDCNETNMCLKLVEVWFGEFVFVSVASNGKCFYTRYWDRVKKGSKKEKFVCFIIDGTEMVFYRKDV